MPRMVWDGHEYFMLPDLNCRVCRSYAWHFATMRPVYATGYWHHPSCQTLRDFNVAFGGTIPMSVILRSGIIIGTVAKLLGASYPGAAVMGFAAALSEAGSGDIPYGWRRWVLGLFSKPEH